VTSSGIIRQRWHFLVHLKDLSWQAMPMNKPRSGEKWACWSYNNARSILISARTLNHELLQKLALSFASLASRVTVEESMIPVSDTLHTKQNRKHGRSKRGSGCPNKQLSPQQLLYKRAGATGPEWRHVARNGQPGQPRNRTQGA